MKKGQLIHTDNLILRIIVTFLGTFGAASIIETITYPLADMGIYWIGFTDIQCCVYIYAVLLRKECKAYKDYGNGCFAGGISRN